MRVGKLEQDLGFKSSRINILSIADNHGDVLKMQQLMKGIKINKKDLFEKSADKSTLNLFAIAGDFFENPLKKGFLTNPHFLSGDIQYNFLNQLMYIARVTSGKNSNFDTVYTIGNHCLDGGDKWLFDKLKRSTMTTVVTNADLQRSLTMQKAMLENKNIVTQKIYEIPDSINPKQNNKLLVLGITIPSMNYYNPGLLKGLHFYNNSNKNDSMLEERDIRKTIRVLKFHIKEFKKLNPDGAIILLSHLGNKLSKILAEKNPEINLILNGHDHKEFESLVGNTLILSHGQSSRFFRGTQLNIGDKGKISIQSKKYEAEQYEPIARKDKNIQCFVNANLKKDLETLVKFNHPGALSKELVLDDSIRYSNNLIANYLTTSIKEIAQKYFINLDTVGLPSTIIRNGLKSHEKRTTMNNIDLLKIFDGINASMEKLKIGVITGKELYDLILENVLNNLKSRTRNALIQWSDIEINKTAIRELKENPTSSALYDKIKIRNPKTQKFENIDFSKNYNILFSEKYLVKDTNDIKVPSQIKSKFIKTEHTYDSLFKEFLESKNYNIKIRNSAREQRII